MHLHDGRVGEIHVALVVDAAVKDVELLAGVHLEQFRVVHAQIDQLFDMVVQPGLPEIAESDLLDVEDREPGRQILVIRRVLRNQIRGGLDQRLVDVAGFDAVGELDFRPQLHQGGGDVAQPFRRPIDDLGDLAQIDQLQAAVSFGDVELGIIVRALPGPLLERVCLDLIHGGTYLTWTSAAPGQARAEERKRFGKKSDSPRPNANPLESVDKLFKNQKGRRSAHSRQGCPDSDGD